MRSNRKTKIPKKRFISLTAKIFLLLSPMIFLSCGGVFYQPHKKIYITPDKFLLKYQEVLIPSPKSEILSAWLLNSSDKLRGTVVFFHGNAENISTHFFQLAWLTKHGYQILIFDYRGYGKSTGRPEREGIYQDARSALKKGWEIHKSSPGSEKFIVYGQSLGGIIAPPAVSGLEFEDKIDLLILDSTFHSYQKIALDKLSSSWLTFILSPLAFVLVNDQLASENYLPKLRPKSFLVLHGSRDQVVPEKFGKTVYQLLPQKKQFKSFPEMAHTQAFSREEHRQWLKNYLEYFDSQEYASPTASWP